MHGVAWKEEPEAHDYPAAEAYLSLLTDPIDARELATRLRGAT